MAGRGARKAGREAGGMPGGGFRAVMRSQPVGTSTREGREVTSSNQGELQPPPGRFIEHTLAFQVSPVPSEPAASEMAEKAVSSVLEANHAHARKPGTRPACAMP